MDRIFIPAIACLFYSCAPASEQLDQAAAGTKPSMELTGRVVDEADLISANVESGLVSKLRLLEKTAGPQFVIATTTSLDGSSIEDYSLNLGRAWQIGHADRDDGVVLLVAPNERKVRIEVGYGLEGTLSDPFCAKVIKETILPHFRKNEMEAGIVAGAERLIEKMERSPTIEMNDNTGEETIAA